MASGTEQPSISLRFSRSRTKREKHGAVGTAPLFPRLRPAPPPQPGCDPSMMSSIELRRSRASGETADDPAGVFASGWHRLRTGDDAPSDLRLDRVARLGRSGQLDIVEILEGRRLDGDDVTHLANSSGTRRALQPPNRLRSAVNLPVRGRGDRLRKDRLACCMRGRLPTSDRPRLSGRCSRSPPVASSARREAQRHQPSRHCHAVHRARKSPLARRRRCALRLPGAPCAAPRLAHQRRRVHHSTARFAPCTSTARPQS